MQKKEWVQKEPTPKIQVDKVPDIEFDIISRAIERELKAFYAVPKSRRGFEEWLKAREAKTA